MSVLNHRRGPSFGSLCGFVRKGDEDLTVWTVGLCGICAETLQIRHCIILRHVCVFERVCAFVRFSVAVLLVLFSRAHFILLILCVYLNLLIS